jgi:broad specificity phosphatase PhoE
VTRLYLVRHGQAAAGWDEDHDPGLSPTGWAQAEAAAAELAPLGPLPIVVSPLRRTRETAAPLAAAWGVEPVADEAVGELPSPTDDLAERGQWLAGLFGLAWDEWPPELQAWRARIPQTLARLAADHPEGVVVVSHYVFISNAAGTRSFHPDFCSVTTADVEDGGVVGVELGRARVTQVL